MLYYIAFSLEIRSVPKFDYEFGSGRIWISSKYGQNAVPDKFRPDFGFQPNFQNVTEIDDNGIFRSLTLLKNPPDVANFLVFLRTLPYRASRDLASLRLTNVDVLLCYEVLWDFMWITGLNS